MTAQSLRGLMISCDERQSIPDYIRIKQIHTGVAHSLSNSSLRTLSGFGANGSARVPASAWASPGLCRGLRPRSGHATDSAEAAAGGGQPRGVEDRAGRGCYDVRYQMWLTSSMGLFGYKICIIYHLAYFIWAWFGTKLHHWPEPLAFSFFIYQLSYIYNAVCLFLSLKP